MTTSNNSTILKDVVAYVDVWSSDKTANYAKPFAQQLQEMGAQVSKTFNKQVTHVVFSNGHPATWRKAKKRDVRLVSVLWVGRCYDDGVHVDEELYPALNDESNPVMKNKKHRCMQPKDSPEKTPENDRRMKKKLDKLMKQLAPKEPLVTDVSPIIIDEENGIVYSPALKRSDYMAQRLKDMKDKRENLSPTASQMIESCSPVGLKPSLGSTPTVFKLMYEQSDEDSSASVAELGYSPDKEEGRTHLDVRNHDHLDQSHRKDSTKPWLSPCHDAPKRIPSVKNYCDIKDKEDQKGNRQQKSGRTSVRKKPKSVDFVEVPCQDRRSDTGKNLERERRQSEAKSQSLLPNKSVKGKQKITATKSFPATESSIYSDTVNSSTSSASLLDDAAAKTVPLQKMAQKTPKRARQSFSALVQSFSLSGESKSVASCSTDGDDDVFDDFFSPANHKQKSKRAPLPDLPVDSDIQIPFDLDPVPKKRKQRRSESFGSETSDKKKRKLEDSQSGKHLNQHSDASSESQSHQQQDVKESLPALDCADETLRAKRQRQSSLALTRTGKSASDTVKQRAASTPVQKTVLTEENTVLELQTNSDFDVLSHTLISE